ncbi:hypothetical protein U7230_07370 [Carboxydochorda subterranea]|uniref:Uncharacterized protein n=1 Tax=Carboxydichorda subterranea TaxID=3109565 RepID=A0ABZ1C1C0_9FIRM|nr:hypothetical protein [Limnochorda sp. L945t]WRP18803.1 hypothetical protein U7230_07370 [Limnochorda sp. L945t]
MGVEVRGWVDLGVYLTEHEGLDVALREVCLQCQELFPSTTLSAEFYKDPEIDSYQYPIVYVHVEDVSSEQFTKLQRVREHITSLLGGTVGWVGVDFRVLS